MHTAHDSFTKLSTTFAFARKLLTSFGYPALLYTVMGAKNGIRGGRKRKISWMALKKDRRLRIEERQMTNLKENVAEGCGGGGGG